MIAASMVAIIFSIPVVALIWLTDVPGRSFVGELPELSPLEKSTAISLQQHISVLSAKPRNIEHFAALKEAAEYIEKQLIELDYSVEFQPFSVNDRTVKNIEAILMPNSNEAHTLIIGAHYDSFGDSKGANDNGSGVAALLELARLLKDLDGISGLRIRFVLFVNEEPPYFKTEYMGSAVYANELIKKDERFLGMLSLETLGFYSDKAGSQRYPPPLSFLYPETGDFVAFVGDTSARTFVRKVTHDFRATVQFPSEGGVAPTLVRGIDWSDHRSFSMHDVPALMVTDTAAFRYPHYHSRKDTADKVDSEKLARVVVGLNEVIRSWSKNEIIE